MGFNLLAKESFENSLLELDWSQDPSIRPGNRSLCVAKSSVLSVVDFLNTSYFSFGWTRELDSFGSFTNVLDSESTSWSSDLSDFVGRSVI
jgi:hypothetical protein